MDAKPKGLSQETQWSAAFPTAARVPRMAVPRSTNAFKVRVPREGGTTTAAVSPIRAMPAKSRTGSRIAFQAIIGSAILDHFFLLRAARDVRPSIQPS